MDKQIFPLHTVVMNYIDLGIKLPKSYQPVLERMVREGQLTKKEAAIALRNNQIWVDKRSGAL